MLRLFFLMMLAALSLQAQPVVLISGASGGIGKEVALAFQEKGWKVWAGYNKYLPIELTNQPNINLCHLDVTCEISIGKAVKAMLMQEGRIDALVNCAGYGLIGAEEAITIKEGKRMMDVNFFGALRLIQAVAPQMRQQNSGHIINISSTSGFRAIPGLGVYAASKFALEGMSESLAVTLSPWNIKVVLVEPGAVCNEWVNNCFYGSRKTDVSLYEEFASKLTFKLRSLVALGQPCSEIAALVVEVAETPNPNMRYQTSDKVRETAAKKLSDLTGNRMRDEQLKFFNDVMVK